MRAIVFDRELRLDIHHPEPEPPQAWARVKVIKAGICQTDLELIKGYMNFTGVLGHEFVGRIDTCADQDRIGQRVVGEINAGCGKCEFCQKNLARHCPNRGVLGIHNLNGCMADFCILPEKNLIPVPDEISDEAAVLIEPLAAACEILEQISPRREDKVIVLGDGRIGMLCAWVLSLACSDVTLVGHHRWKLETAQWGSLKTCIGPLEPPGGADIVVEATGSEAGIVDAISLCRPRGTLVLKTTVAQKITLDLSPIVINELTLVGSRCGRFSYALGILRQCPDLPLTRLISRTYPVTDAISAFHEAHEGETLKVLIDFKD